MLKSTPAKSSAPSVVPVAPVAPPIQPASAPAPTQNPPATAPEVPSGSPTAPTPETQSEHAARIVPLNRLQPAAGVVVKTGSRPVRVPSGALIPPNSKTTVSEADALAAGKSVTRVP